MIMVTTLIYLKIEIVLMYVVRLVWISVRAWSQSLARWSTGPARKDWLTQATKIASDPNLALIVIYIVVAGI